MITWPVPIKSAPTFTTAEWEALQVLRLRYQRDRDLFSARELARLRFIRWLRQTRRIEQQEY
jgi:hypothetical protein